MTATLSDAELLARLVAFDSTSCNSNIPIADFVCDYLDGSGVEIHRNPNDDGTKVNVIAQVAGRDDAGVDRGLTLLGHLDVVPAVEPEWKGDPFTLRETHDAYIARGACDMKGFVALAVGALRRAATQTLAHPLALILTFDEELGTLGAQHLVRTWAKPFVLPTPTIVGEPTCLKVVRMHKGHLKARVTVSGKGAHSAYPHLGVNAIERAGRVIAALADLRKQLMSERSNMNPFFAEAPFVALNVTQARGGTAINIIPDRCELDLSVRVLPGMKSTDTLDRIRSTVAGVDDVGEPIVEMIDDSPPLLTGEDTAIHRTLCEIVSQRESFGVSYASDAGPLQTLGLECVVFGPGSIEVAHKPNESLPKAEFVRARSLLDLVIERFCGV